MLAWFRFNSVCRHCRLSNPLLPQPHGVPLRLFGSSTDLAELESNDDSDGEPSEDDEPWKTLLEMPARAAWRVTAGKPPSTLEQAQRVVLDESFGRSNKHLRQTLADMAETHRKLASRRDRERFRTIKNLEYKKKDRQQDEVSKVLLYGPEEALTSFKHRLYPNYAIVHRVLEETKSLLGWTVARHQQPRRVLDFGMGTGSAAAASLDVFDTVEWIHGIDPSQTMREAAQRFLEEKIALQHNPQQTVEDQNEGTSRSSTPGNNSSGKPQPRVTLSAHLSAESTTTSGGGAFDLALFCHTATELPHNEAILAAAALLWEKLTPGGLFVMIEPGTPDGFSSIRTVRNMLLACCPPSSSEDEAETDDECHIIAPCTHNGPCPMERFDLSTTLAGQQQQQRQIDQGDGHQHDGNESDGDDEVERNTRKGFCSFVQTMPGGTARARGEKFSYLVAQKRVAGDLGGSQRQKHSFDDVSLPDLLDRTLSISEDDTQEELDGLYSQAKVLSSRFLGSDEDDLGLELVRGDRERSMFGRIIHSPKKRKGHVLVDCCAGGEIVRHKVPKSLSSKFAPGLYPAARKSRWGGLWPHVESTQDHSSEENRR